jgi:hypothetical protein
VILNPRRLTQEERRELFKPPEDKYDAKWLEIPTFLRRLSNVTDDTIPSDEFQDDG